MTKQLCVNSSFTSCKMKSASNRARHTSTAFKDRMAFLSYFIVLKLGKIFWGFTLQSIENLKELGKKIRILKSQKILN